MAKAKKKKNTLAVNSSASFGVNFWLVVLVLLLVAGTLSYVFYSLGYSQGVLEGIVTG